jgi:hypothetical protein
MATYLSPPCPVRASKSGSVLDIQLHFHPLVVLAANRYQPEDELQSVTVGVTLHGCMPTERSWLDALGLAMNYQFSPSRKTHRAAMQPPVSHVQQKTLLLSDNSRSHLGITKHDNGTEEVLPTVRGDRQSLKQP